MPDTVLNKLARMQGRHYPRRLPHSANGEGPVAVAGIGTFGVLGVGSHKYSGIEVTLMLDGADEAEPGKLRYHTEIGEDFQVRWVLDEATLDYGDHDGRRLGARVWEAAQAVADGMADRAPIAWAFGVATAAETELATINGKLKSTRSQVDGVARQLATERDADARAQLATRLARSQAAAAAAQARSDARGTALRSLLQAWRDYSGLTHRERTAHVRDVFADALRNPVAPQTRRRAYA